jgi:hypothetical protein
MFGRLKRIGATDMAITYDDAVNAKYRDEFHGPSNRGKIITVRVNGKCKIWKTRPGEFQLPVKYGMYECGYITHSDLARWTKGHAP